MAAYTVKCYESSDTGDFDRRGQRRLPRDTPREDVEKRALELAREHGAPFVVLTRTSPYHSKPGAWYIKGFKDTRYTCEETEALIEQNKQVHKYKKRDCFIIIL